MTKDEALDLALEALESERPYLGPMPSKTVKAITAIKQARALDKKAENARELGLDYEPVHKPYRPLQDNGSQYFGDSWDTLPAQPAPAQEPDLIARLKHPEHYYEFTDPKKANAVLMSLCQEAADALKAFEALVRADEREACAKVCDARYMGDNNREDMEAKRCAAAIRARGNT